MKTAERTAAPAVGNALGLILALWAIDHYEWLPVEQREYIVLACGTLCIHFLQEFRTVVAYAKGYLAAKKK